MAGRLRPLTDRRYDRRWEPPKPDSTRFCRPGPSGKPETHDDTSSYAIAGGKSPRTDGSAAPAVVTNRMGAPRIVSTDCEVDAAVVRTRFAVESTRYARGGV